MDVWHLDQQDFSEQDGDRGRWGFSDQGDQTAEKKEENNLILVRKYGVKNLRGKNNHSQIHYLPGIAN